MASGRNNRFHFKQIFKTFVLKKKKKVDSTVKPTEKSIKSAHCLMQRTATAD